MVTVNTESLAETLDVVNDAFFYGQVLAKSERKDIAKWIAETRSKAGSDYAKRPAFRWEPRLLLRLTGKT